jgi:hypothetical protein
MPKKAPIKKLRAQQLYALGLPTTKIGPRFLTSSQAVSKMLKLRGNPELRQQHTANRTLNRKLSAGGSLPRMPMRVKELYALGLNIEDISLLLAVPRPDVFMLVDADAELERLHAARTALDRKLATRRPVTEADFIADCAAPVPDADRGELAPNGAPAAVEEAAPTEEMQPPDEQPADEQIQPPDDALHESPEVAPVEQPEVLQPQQADDDAPDEQILPLYDAPDEQPADEHSAEVQPPDAPDERLADDEHSEVAPAAVLQLPDDAPEEHAEEEVQPPDLPRAAPQTSSEGETADAAAAVHLVLKHVGTEYRLQPDQLTIQEAPTPPQWWQPQPSKDELQLQEARQVVVFIALRVTGLSRGQLAAILGCHPSTIDRAYSEILPIFLAAYARRERMLGIEARICQEAGLKFRETIMSRAQP